MSFLESINPFDGDSGLDIKKAPILRRLVKDGGSLNGLYESNTTCDAENAVKRGFNGVIVTGAGVAGGGLLGYKLGENFGTIGKLAGGITGAYLGSKLSNGVASDVAAASDAAKNSNGKLSQLKATAANFGNFSGQTYDGKTEFDDV